MADRITHNFPQKPSAYYFRSLDSSQNNSTNIHQLITRLSQSYQCSNSEQINSILDNRRNKLVELRKMRSKYILQNPMIPASSTQRFSYVTPISSQEKYLHQKKRLNILIPDRAYNDQPNIRAGSLDRTKMMSYDSNYDPRVVSKKFQEFIRLVEDQSGSMKKQRLSSLTKSKDEILPKIKLQKKVSMKNTYFKRFVSDQYNFYKPPIKDISRVQKMFDQSSNRQSTDRSRTIQAQSSRQSSPRANHTLEINSNYGQSQKKLRFILKTLDPYKNA